MGEEGEAQRILRVKSSNALSSADMVFEVTWEKEIRASALLLCFVVYKLHLQPSVGVCIKIYRQTIYKLKYLKIKINIQIKGDVQKEQKCQ